MGEGKRRRQAQRQAVKTADEEMRFAEKSVKDHVAPGLAEVTWDIVPAPTDKVMMAGLRFFSETGYQVYFFSPDKLKLFADSCYEAAKRAEVASGLIKPESKIIIPKGA